MICELSVDSAVCLSRLLRAVVSVMCGGGRQVFPAELGWSLMFERVQNSAVLYASHVCVCMRAFRSQANDLYRRRDIKTFWVLSL